MTNPQEENEEKEVNRRNASILFGAAITTLAGATGLAALQGQQQVAREEEIEPYINNTTSELLDEEYTKFSTTPQEAGIKLRDGRAKFTFEVPHVLKDIATQEAYEDHTSDIYRDINTNEIEDIMSEVLSKGAYLDEGEQLFSTIATNMADSPHIDEIEVVYDTDTSALKSAAVSYSIDMNAVEDLPNDNSAEEFYRETLVEDIN